MKQKLKQAIKIDTERLKIELKIIPQYNKIFRKIAKVASDEYLENGFWLCEMEHICKKRGKN